MARVGISAGFVITVALLSSLLLGTRLTVLFHTGFLLDVGPEMRSPEIDLPGHGCFSLSPAIVGSSQAVAQLHCGPLYCQGFLYSVLSHDGAQLTTDVEDQMLFLLEILEQEGL